MERTAIVNRSTKETVISIELNLDGSGRAAVNTGIGFFDHMLESFARHGFFDLQVTVNGDLDVDTHHTVEDTGIVLGKAISQALGDKRSIRRYGSVMLPMDEALVLCALDLSGRPYLVYDASLAVERIGAFETQMVKEFFYAVTVSAGMNLHIRSTVTTPII